jgi:xanthine/uracil permease
LGIRSLGGWRSGPGPTAGPRPRRCGCIVLSGIQIIQESEAGPRKTFVVGLALAFGLSLDLVPDLFGSAPGFLRPVLASPLTLATMLAVVINQVPRLQDLVPPGGTDAA